MDIEEPLVLRAGGREANRRQGVLWGVVQDRTGALQMKIILMLVYVFILLTVVLPSFVVGGILFFIGKWLVDFAIVGQEFYHFVCVEPFE